MRPSALGRQHHVSMQLWAPRNRTWVPSELFAVTNSDTKTSGIGVRTNWPQATEGTDLDAAHGVLPGSEYSRIVGLLHFRSKS